MQSRKRTTGKRMIIPLTLLAVIALPLWATAYGQEKSEVRSRTRGSSRGDRPIRVDISRSANMGGNSTGSAGPVFKIMGNYFDDFNTDPDPGNWPQVSFTTGSAATGLTYTFSPDGDGGDFSWVTTGGHSNSGVINVLSAAFNQATTEKITIVSRDGKAFIFNSVYLDVIGDGITVTGSGSEAFTIFASNGSKETFSPSGGSKLVTEVEFSSTDFYEDYIDNVNVELDVPGMDVQGNGVTIVNGDNFPAAGDHTDFGSTPSGTPVSRTFTISSIGDLALDLTGSPYVTLSGSGDFSVTSQPTTDPIASGGSDTFTVQCNPSGAGARTATVSISNDSEAHPYTFDVQCTGTSAPEINVERPSGTTIADGGTDNAGNRPVGSAVTFQYTVRNTGSEQLNVTNITSTAASNVTVNSINPTSFSVASGGGTATFDVQYTVTAGGAFSFELDVTNNDADEGNYDITVSGTGDNDPPGITSFARQTPATSPTNADQLIFRATFDEDVQNVGTADFSVNSTSTAGVTNVAVVTANSVYDVTVSGGNLASFNGTVNLNLAGGQDITDLVGNALPAGEPGTDETYTVDNDAPGLTSFARQTPATSPTNADQLVFRATFDEDVQNVGTADFSVNSTSTAGVTNVAVVTANSVYDVTVSGGDLASFNGTVNLNLAGGQDITDLAGNALPTGEPGTDETYTVDNDAPGLTSFARQTPATSPTNADQLIFRATFDEDVQNVGTADFSVNSTSTATVTNVAVVTATSVYDVTVSGGNLATFNGTVNLNLAGGQDIQDPAGNALPAGEPGTDETYTVDNDPPGITSFARQTPATSPTNADQLVFRATFDEDVQNVGTADFSVNSTSTATVTNVAVATANSVYDVTVSGGNLATFNGTVNLNLAGGQDITDLVGNALPAGEPGTDETYTVDNDAPGLTSFARQTPATSPTNADQLVFRATFDEDVQNVGTADFSVNSTSTAAVSGVNQVSASIYDVTMSGGDLASFNGTVNLNLAGGQDIQDLAGNALPAGEPGTDETYLVDNVAPTPTIDQAGGQTDPTSASPINFTVDFGEDVTGFANGDIITGGTAPGALSAAVTGGPQTYNVAVSGMTGDGTVTINFNAGAAADNAGNNCAVPTLTDNEVTYNHPVPEIDVQRPVGTSIADGGTDNVGNQAGGAVNLTYTIDNTAGTAQLTVTGATPSNYTNSSGFSVVTAMPLKVAAGATSTMQVSFNVDAAGAFSLDMDIANDDANENPYDITISGTGLASEIDVQRPAGTSIGDGGTDALGNKGVGVVNLTYTIDNTAGTSQLAVTGATASNYTNSSGFSVVTAMPLNVAAGATSTMQVSFNTTADGAFSLDMDIANNDMNENPYDITISGTVTDADGDGIVDADEGAGDRDGDGTLDHLDYDPAGWIYNENTGDIISGGTISVTPPAGVTIAHDGSSGYYQFFVSSSGTYTLSYTPPAGYNLSVTRAPQAGPLDPTGGPNPYVVGDGSKDGATNKMTDWTEANNPYYWTFALALTDPLVINNNLPLTPDADYGDAPDPVVATAGQYPTLLANNGPRHTVGTNLMLGASVDADADGQQGVGAMGDDTDGADDEDGVDPTQLVIFKGVAPSITVTLKNTTGNPATLSGWIDYDSNGIFETTERAQTAVPNGATQATLVFPVVPMTAPLAGYARFRIATNAAEVANPTGLANDGEVEDYPVAVGGMQVVLTNPNAGEWIRGGSAFEVTWYTVPPNIGRIALYLSKDGGYSYPDLIADGLPNNGKYVWTTPGINNRNCRVKIEVHGSLLAQDVSNANFTIDSTPPHVVLTYPVGGVTWIAGGTYTITWNPATDNFRLADRPISLHYTTDNWKTYTVFAADLDNTGSHDWTVPASLAGTTTLQIKARAVDYVGNVYCGHHGGTITVQAAPSPMMVTYPNGGETLAGGSKQAITWTSNVPSSKVNISYSLDGGGTYPYEIAINEANDGVFGWTVPMMNTRKLRLKIKAHGGAITEEDASDENVTIDDTPPVVTLISPNGGEILEAGGSCTIGWTAEDNYGLSEGPILLMYSEDCGISFSDTIAVGEANDGTFGWLVPVKLNTGKLRILIEATDRAGQRKRDMSDADLRASPAMLSLTSPLGGEKWQGGTTHEIIWNSALAEGTVTLKYSTDGGTTYPNLIAKDEANDGSYGWTLPSLNSRKMRVKIEVQSARTAEAVNHVDFTIDSSPPNLTLQSLNGGDSLEAGGSYEIRWTAFDNFGLEEDPITITCSTDGGFTYPNTITAGQANDSSHTWITPINLKSDKVRLKIEAIDETGLKRSAYSAGTFTVMPVEITIVSPDGGEVWRGMTTQRIAWTSNFTTGIVSLFYSTDGGSTYPHSIATGLTNAIGSYDWEVPQINEESVRVRADLRLQNHTQDVSNGNFEIQHHAPEVILIYPSGGETWEANSVNQIIWTARDDYFGLIEDPITIHYSTDGGRTFPHTIAKKELNDSTYMWTTPRDLNSPNVRIKVEALNMRDVSGYDTIDEDMGILNPPPVVSNLPDSTFETSTALYFSLNPYVRDNNDKLLTLMWSTWSSEPAVEVLINNDNKWVTILARNWTGEADIVLTVTDPFGDSDSDTMHVVVHGQTSVDALAESSVPESFVLHHNYPNPFNPQTTISYGLPEASDVTITVFDMNGKHVTDLFEGRKEVGVHILRWNAIDCPSGVYFISMRAGRFVQMRKCVLMK